MLTETRPEIESAYEYIWHRLFVSRTQFVSDFVYKTKSLVSARGGFINFHSHGLVMIFHLFIASMDNGIANTNQAVFKYRRHSFTISTTGNVKLKLDAIFGR